MTNEEAKRWAELFTALAEGKTIEQLMTNAADDLFVWVQVSEITTLEELDNYRIKPQPKTRRRTYQELSDWVRDYPEEHREWKYADSDTVFVVCKYAEDDANNEVSSDVLIRRNHGKWQKPLIVEE